MVRSWRRLLFFLLALGVAGAGFIKAPYLVITPGPVLSLGEMVSVDDRHGQGIHMVTISAKEANWYEVIGAAISPKVDVWPKDALLAGSSIEEYSAKMARSMEESRDLAVQVAIGYAGLGDDDPVHDRVQVETANVGGPSAGLALALEVYTALSGEDLTHGGKVAATGVIDAQGNVLPVGGLEQKTRGCRDAGIELFLVPIADLKTARSSAQGMQIIGVDSFQDAVRALVDLRP